MKSKILLTVISIYALLQFGCKKVSEKDSRGGLGRFAEMESFSSSSLSTMDFCALTSKETELHFGLDRPANMNSYVFTEEQVFEGMANFRAQFKYNNAGVIEYLDTPNQSLNLNDLITLYNVLQYDSTTGYDPDTNYSALRIHFGMEGKKIILIYEPIVLVPILPKECTVVGTSKYYRTDSTNVLIPVSSIDFITLTSNLRGGSSKIHILHPTFPTVFSFINSSDSSGDIRSNIISFQQVCRMYCDNASTVSSYSDRINFTIVANQNAALTGNFRMHIVPNFNLGMSSAVAGSYKSYAADYMQMCPTTCASVSVNYYD